MDLSNTPSPVSPERDRLAALDRLGILDTAPEREFDDLTRLAAAALSVDSAAISLVDDHRQWFKARHGIPFSETSRNDAFCARVVDSGDMMVVTDAHLHPEFQNNPLVLGKDGIRFYVGIPIKSAGHCVGTLCVFDPKPRSGLTSKQTELLLELAKLATDLIESRRARRMGEITAKVVSATSDAIVAVDGDGVIVFWNPAAETMFGYSSEDALGQFIDLFLLSNSDDGTPSRPLFPDPDGMAGVTGKFVEHRAVRADGDIFPIEMSMAPWGDIESIHGHALIIRDIGGRKTLEREREHARTFLDNVVTNLPAMLFVKDVASRRYLVVNEAGEKVIGREAVEMIGRTDAELFPAYGAGYEQRDDEAIAARTPHHFESAFTRDDGETIHLRTTRKLIDGPDGPNQYILGISEDVTQVRRKEAEVLRLALHDPLTGLLNRASFTDRLHRKVQNGEPFALLSIDLDRFKSVNDQFGHPAGDDVLKQVAQRIRSLCAAGESLARVGGDEFFAILPGENQRERASQLCQTILTTIAEPLVTDRGVAHLGASIGVVLAPQDGTATEQLRENVDIALYRAKQAGRAGACFFNAEMDATARDRRDVSRLLRKAVAAAEITLLYQPVVSARSGEVTSAEALARWTDPDKGPISPDLFIPLAEECGLIDTLGTQLLHQACLDAQNWPANIRVAVNLSPLQFLSGDLPRTVAQALTRSGLTPNRLQLEVTEGLVIRDVERTFEQLEKLRNLGIQILIDDFGVGCSSLSYFQRFRFDKVKIDKSFIDQIASSRTSRAIVQAVVGLGRELGMGIVAEGVETKEQMEVLVALGCTHLQGYLFSRPLPAEQFAR